MGFASGFQVGASAVERGLKLRDEEQLRRALAQESAKYTPTEGAYGPELAQNIEQLRGLQAQNPDTAAQYEPAIAELTRRQGLTAPDYSVASGAQNFATRQEAMQAAAPMRTEGLANVYRQAGQIDKAEELVTRAQQQRMAGLQISEAERLKAERDAATKREQQNAAAWKDRLSVKDPEGNVTGMRPPTTEDMLWAAQQSAQSLYGAGKTNEAMAAYKDYMTTAKGQIDLQSAERAEVLKGVIARVNQGDFGAAKDFYHKYVPDGTNVRTIEPGKDGKLIIKREDLHGAPLPTATVTKEQILQQLVAFENPAKLLDYTQQSFMNGLHERQLEETKRHNKANEGLAAQRLSVEKEGPLATTLKTLRKNGIDVSQDDMRSLAGLNKEDNALLKAQVDAVLKGVDPLQPKTVDTARAQIQGLFTQAAATKQQAQVQAAAKRANKDGKLPEFVQELRSRDVADDVIAAQLRAAGVPVPPELLPPPEPAPATVQQGPSFMQRLFPGGGSYQPTPAVGLSR